MLISKASKPFQETNNFEECLVVVFYIPPSNIIYIFDGKLFPFQTANLIEDNTDTIPNPLEGQLEKLLQTKDFLLSPQECVLNCENI